MLRLRRMEAEALRTAGLKKCGKCKQDKSLSEFHIRRASPDGLAYKCINCMNEDTKAWRQKNPNAFRIWHENNRDHRAEYWQEWYSANREARSESYAAWARENKHIVNALIAKRTAAKKRALPQWANLEAIRAIYQEAARITRETGIRHEVDHIYPLQGKTVCGLHCEANLQILTKTENIRKKNQLPPLLECAA